MHVLINDPNTKSAIQDKFGDTVLHFAARDGQQDVCDLLLKQNSRLVMIKNQEGKTAMNYAQDYLQTQVVALLRTHDATAGHIDRDASLRALAKELMDEPANWKNSIFKPTLHKIPVFGDGRRMCHEDLIIEQTRLLD
mgnify:CR=1 FL=1